MSDPDHRPLSYGIAKNSPPGDAHRLVLITGACSGIGHACAEALASSGAELILCDKDAGGVRALAAELGAASLFCDVGSESSVRGMAAEILGQHVSLDMVINAAGGGYERTLGMYRVSRALLPALRQSSRPFLVNIPPSSSDGDAAIFPYASSAFAFHRLSAALAFETREMPVGILIGCPESGRVTQVLPDPNGGTWADSCKIRQPNLGGVRTMAWQIATLLGDNAANSQRAS
jgi:NAD(P)-dependent dehydrogenase (short-subunit alcohol dehydrogenase family)